MRQFLAIPLPESLRRAACASRDVLAPRGDGWRFVREDGLHLTLRFLGEVDPSRLGGLDAAWRHAVGGTGPLALRLRGAGVFPETGRPRILWLGIDDETGEGSLARLADRLEGAARAQGFPPEGRPFAAHVTLARARPGPSVVRPSLARVGDFGAFVAERVVLYRSELGPGGSTYHEEASYPLIATVAS
jgi:RNA 2',3'-cyclic 3'-phosphodiesterase